VSIEATAKITLIGASEALKSLQGVTRETGAAGKAAKSAADTQAAAAKKAAAAQEAAAKKAAQAQEAAAKKAADASIKEGERWAKAAQQSAMVRMRAQEKEAQAAKRIQEEAARVAARELAKVTEAAAREAAKQKRLAEKTAAAEAKARRETLRQVGGLMVTAGSGLAAGIGVAVSTARGGSKSVQERIAAGNEFRERLFSVTGAAGQTAEQREATQGKIIEASKATGKDQSELLGVVETGHAQFGDLQFFADNIKEIATIAKVANADTGEFAKAIGSVKQAFNLTGEEAIQAGYLMSASADKGSVELKDFARDFAASAGIFSMNTGQKGIGGVRQFLGASQGIATGQFGSAESATRLERFITDVNDVKVRKELKGIGISNVADASGKVDVGRLLDQLGNNSKFKSAATRQKVFTETRSLQAVESLLAAREREKTGGVGFKTIAGVSEEAGRAAISGGFASLSQEGFFKNQVAAAEMQADTMSHLDEMNTQLGAVSGAADTLEKSFGALSIWASSIAAMGVTSVLSAAIQGKLFGGAAAESGGLLGKAAGAVGGAAGASASALSATAAAGGLAGGAVMAGGALVAGAAGYALGEGINAGTSALRDDKQSLSDLLAGVLEQLASGGLGDAKSRIGATIVNSDGGSRTIVAELKEINAGLKAAAAKPTAGAPREPR
jgi:hypothetical protein